jgi:hypothetical protein
MKNKIFAFLYKLKQSQLIQKGNFFKNRLFLVPNAKRDKNETSSFDTSK